MNIKSDAIEQLTGTIDQDIGLQKGKVEELGVGLGRLLIEVRQGGSEDALKRHRAMLQQARTDLLDLEAMKLVLPDYVAQMRAERQIQNHNNREAQIAAEYEKQKAHFDHHHDQALDSSEIRVMAEQLYNASKPVGKKKETIAYFRELSIKGDKYNVLKKYKVRV
jgi:hypothetical protein